MNITQLTSLLIGYSSEGLGHAFSQGVDVSWDDYYDLKGEVEKITGKFISGNLTISGHDIPRSKTVPNGAVWPCNCKVDQRKQLEEHSVASR